MADEMTYSKAGVSIEKEELAIKKIRSLVEKTFQFREGKKGEVIRDIGSFANIVDIGNGNALAMAMDGVGSKILVAKELKKYNTVGIDLVAMNVNDLICIGAEPISMVDYLGATHMDPVVVREISVGLYEGAKRANISIVGGETATLPDIIQGDGGFGFDLVGTAVGIVKIDDIITGEGISVGDVVLGIKSSGIHSNGLTLARKVLPKNMWVDLLCPTRIYVNEFMELSSKFKLLGLAHITGGGFKNLLRMTEYGFYIDNPPKPQMVFKRIQEEGNVSDKEMYKTFNMGIGLSLVVKEEEAKKILKEHGAKFNISKIGGVVEDRSVTIEKEDEEIKLN